MNQRSTVAVYGIITVMITVASGRYIIQYDTLIQYSRIIHLPLLSVVPYSIQYDYCVANSEQQTIGPFLLSYA